MRRAFKIRCAPHLKYAVLRFECLASRLKSAPSVPQMALRASSGAWWHGETLQEDSRREGIYYFNPPNQRRTFVLPTPYLRRCILGFRPRAKSEDAAAQVGGW